ncbi:uncharacterized protein C10orf105 homolog [Colius striatus]|uniref:uncharacterized protein C10orf105 homolog n=1 Tax=Colius striatus TaxID=57412 RepID=UPI002B1E3E04|nr:uncharacterized protein C10orf105 homolog [Colius striatus]
MSTEDAGNGTSPTPPLLEVLLSTTELVPPSPASPEEADPLPIIIALICLFLLVATFFTFFSLCRLRWLGQPHLGPREHMPHHPADASEPRLRLWKRLGSLRRSVSAFRRSQPVSHSQQACSRSSPPSQDWDITESTKM